MDLSELRQDFISEVEVLLSKLDDILIELEKEMEDEELVSQTFRIMHTIKGSSGMYGFEKVVSITHELESLYDSVRNGERKVNSRLIELSFAVSDHLKQLLVDEFCTEARNAEQHIKILDHIEKVKGDYQEEEKPGELQPGEKSVATWNIIYYTNDKEQLSATDLTNTFEMVFALGDYRFCETPIVTDDMQYWSIYLSTGKDFNDIENALLFAPGCFEVTKIADHDIFKQEEYNKAEKRAASGAMQRDGEEGEGATADNAPVAELKKEGPASATKKQGKNRIHVDSEKLDTLMYLVSELVTTKSELKLALQKGNETKAMESAEKIDKLSKMFSNNTLSIRLVPLLETINKFKRLVRDLSKELGKDIRFETAGEETELDKNIIDVIGEPIMHIIRNCVDHGIEKPSARGAAGKPSTGVVSFDAVTVGNCVHITISDDGNGIDPQKVLAKAEKRLLVAPDATLTEEQIIELIFLPGFSTAENVSNISGRGVGMDIVLKKIKEIRGEISIKSTPGRGTSFIIKLQQTISIINALLVEADDITYAIPVEDIDSCIIELREHIVNKQNNVLDFNGELIPFINLRTKFNPGATLRDSETDKIVIIKKLNKKYALVTDTIIGEYQAVIKPLGKTFYDIEFLSGASLLGDGSIALLLDTDKLWSEMTA